MAAVPFIVSQVAYNIPIYFLFSSQSVANYFTCELIYDVRLFFCAVAALKSLFCIMEASNYPAPGIEAKHFYMVVKLRYYVRAPIKSFICISE